MATTYDLDTPSPKLAPNHQFPAKPRTLGLILARYDLEAQHIQRLIGGHENETFKVKTTLKTYVLRVYRNHRKQPADIYRELDFMLFLGKQDVPVPRVFETTDGHLVNETTIDGVVWQSILMNYLSGEHPQTYSMALLAQMAQVQAHMHLLGNDYALGDRGHQVHLEAATTSPLHRLGLTMSGGILGFAQHQLPRGIVHFDFTTSNLLLKNNQISAILDFDDMTHAPLVSCLAITLTRLPRKLQTAQITASYIEAYAAVRPLTFVERLYLQILLPLKRLRHRLG